MLQADIVALEHRQQFLEHEILEALRDVALNDPMIVDLKSRVLFIKEEIDRLRHAAFVNSALTCLVRLPHSQCTAHAIQQHECGSHSAGIRMEDILGSY